MGAKAEKSPVTKEGLRRFVASGINEAKEAIEKEKPANQYARRGESHLGVVLTKLQDAQDVLDGKRKTSNALLWVIEHATKEELQQVELLSKEQVRAIKTGLGLGKSGEVYVQQYPKTSLGQSHKNRDLEIAKDLPNRVKARSEVVQDFVKEKYGEPRSL